MLSVSWVQNIVLLVFTFLMFEVMTPATMIFVVAGIVLVFLHIKTNKLVRNILALGIFASYWITYGKIIDPEVGLNFLTSIIVLKIMERETIRDRYMIFFGLVLLISAGSLFERTITYVIFFTTSFLLLIRDFYGDLGQKARLRDLGISMVWVLPLTFLLFFLVPRMLNPIPFQQGGRNEGEVGYTPDVRVSEVESLASNTNPVFQVLTSRRLKQDELYWRGNTLSYTDGWNWNVMVQDRSDPIRVKDLSVHPNDIKQNFRLFNRSDYFFGLDIPHSVSFNGNNYELGPLKTLNQGRWQWNARYEVISSPEAISNHEDLQKYLAVNLPRKTKNWIQDTFKGQTLSELHKELRDYFYRQGFAYSLSPGRSASFEEFMQTKKIGLCSHYSSALAIILRTKNIPARLVSGFMGGSYNQYADFYLISQNDAHVWVEVFDQGTWKRVDPTEWIAPDRVQLGGEAFMEGVQNGIFQKTNLTGRLSYLQDLKKWFAQWDYMFYTWLEEMDYYTQEAWLTRFKFKREWLFSVIPMMMVIFMGIYTAFLAYRRRRENPSLHQDTWNLFYQKMGKLGVKISVHSVEDSETILRKSEYPKKDQVLGIWRELVQGSFGHKKDLKEVFEKIKRL